ncbi:hypothetical protein H2200_006589 [Cladophialophora chaetospira]|uniref:DUF726-domain-containing protein n=1 Tax=Cladophialophora chaetospira TaxID=386627 RepID=A0AA39CHV4_9EURO|nr:hypothetical protein H2200_006589 [Cladophialophora chaetospira]
MSERKASQPAVEGQKKDASERKASQPDFEGEKKKKVPKFKDSRPDVEGEKSKDAPERKASQPDVEGEKKKEAPKSEPSQPDVEGKKDKDAPERKASEPAVEGQKNKDETDLSTVLDKSQRADLTLLVANATESMRKLIVDNFDATAGLDKSLLRTNLSEDEKLMAADPSKADVSAYDKERKLKAEIEKDLGTLKMKNLKKNSLKAFDGWREQVILRVGQVVNSEKTAQEQVQKGAKADQGKPLAPNTSGKVTEAGNRKVNLKFKDLFPPTKTPLTKMAMNQRTLVLHSLLLLLLSLEHYNAYSRVLLLNVTSSLKLPLKTFEQDEYATAKGLLEAAKEMTADDEIKKKIKENEETRKKRVRYATIAGAAILGVSGSMAAPLMAAGVGSIMGGLGLGTTTAAAYLGSVAGSTVLVGSLFGAYGGKMTGQMMDNYAREVEDFQFLPVHGSSDKKTSEDEEQGAQEASEHDHKLRVTIGISGWLTEKEEVVKPWRSLGTGAEVFALKYELEALLNLGNAMNGMVQSAAWGYAQKELVAQTVFADLAAAMWPLALMKVARVIDNPFSVAKSRADKAGEVLADALINRAQGERPVTLIGYSLGARVIYTCLMSLAKRKEFGLVENAVLIGAPTPSDTGDWRVLRSAVAGRLVNVFSVNDYVLGFMYRTSAVQFGVAGLQKVEGLAAVENFDVSEDVSSHQRYRYLIGGILKKIGFEDIDMGAVEREQEELKAIEKEEKRQTRAAQKKWMLRRESNGGKADEAAEGEAEADELEKKVQEQTQKSLVTKAIEYFYTPSVPTAKDAQKFADNLQKAARDPASARQVAGETAKDVQSSAAEYANYIYKHLPSMPYANRTSATSTAQKSAPVDPSKTKEATKAVEGAAAQGQSYVQQASQYLPSLPSLPSRGKGKEKGKKPKPETATEKATDSASKAAETGTAVAKGTAGAVSDTVNTTVKNTLNPKDNPAVKSTKQALDKTPVIHQAKDRTPAPVKEKAGEVTDAAGTTVQNAAQTVQKGLDSTTGKAGEAGKAGADKAGDAGKAAAGGAQKGAETVTSGAQQASQAVTGNAQKAGDTAKGGAQQASQTVTDNAQKAGDTAKGGAEQAGKAATDGVQTAAKTGQSYTSKAASYIPSFGFGGAKKPAPSKLDKKPSESKVSKEETKSTPKLDKKPSESKVSKEESKSAPKLDRTPSGVKSPPAKLDRTPSGVKSPPAKLDRTPSGVKSPPTSVPTPSGIKSPPAKLARTPSGVKSPPTSVPTPNLEKRKSSVSGVKSPPKLGARKSSSQQSPAPPAPAAIGERLASIPQNAGGAAKGASESATGAAKQAGSSATEGAKTASSAATSTAKAGSDAVTGAASSATNAAGKAGETGKNVAGEAAKKGSGFVSGLGRSVGFGR